MKVFIKPAPGLKIRDPETKIQLPEEGAQVEKSSFWSRRIKAGDVVQVEALASKKEEAKKEEKSEKINLKQGDK